MTHSKAGRESFLACFWKRYFFVLEIGGGGVSKPDVIVIGRKVSIGYRNKKTEVFAVWHRLEYFWLFNFRFIKKPWDISTLINKNICVWHLLFPKICNCTKKNTDIYPSIDLLLKPFCLSGLNPIKKFSAIVHATLDFRHSDWMLLLVAWPFSTNHTAWIPAQSKLRLKILALAGSGLCHNKLSSYWIEKYLFQLYFLDDISTKFITSRFIALTL